MSYELSVTRLGVYQTKGYLATDARMSYGLWVISYEAGRLPDKSLSCHRCTDELRVMRYPVTRLGVWRAGRFILVVHG